MGFLEKLFKGGDDVLKARKVLRDLGNEESLGRRKEQKLANAQGVIGRHSRNRILAVLGFVGVVAASIGGGVSYFGSSSKQDNPELEDGLLADSATPETDRHIELPEFSIEDIKYQPSVPEGLEMAPSRFREIGVKFFDSIEKDFPKFKKAFDDTGDPRDKGKLVSDHIVKYYDYLLSLDPKISTHANSKSMGTLNERCSYMTLFLIGQGRYISVVNPDPDRRYPKLLYGESKIEREMDVQYEGHHVEFPIVEIDAHAGEINRGWYDSNNKLMMYLEAETTKEARAMAGRELNSGQLAEFADVMTVSILRHEGTHALTREMFPRGTAEKSLRSGHRVTLEKMNTPSTQKDWRRPVMQGIEVSELTAVGVEMANFPHYLKLYSSYTVPQVVFKNQYQQAHIHLLTYFVNRRTIPLPLRRKVQAFLAVFPRGNPRIIHDVMMDPSLPEAELAEIGKQLFETGIKMFEQIEQESHE